MARYRYYCTTCKGAIGFGVIKDLSVIGGNCHLCNRRSIVPIPDYETPARYEKRTGKAYPDNGIIFEQLVAGDGLLYWSSNVYKSADKQNRIVIADPPVPPPDDFVPEEL